MATAATTGSNIATNVGQQTSTESSLSNWAGPYVTEMLGKARALSEAPYQEIQGPLTAGESTLQKQAFSGIGGLTIPTEQMQAYTPQTFTSQAAQQYMNPYLQAALDPQIAEARRQAGIERTKLMGGLTGQGGLGGGRQAIVESELNRALLSNLAGITGKGYQTAYDKAMEQFNIEQNRQQLATKQAQDYGLSTIQKMADLGATQRGIEQAGITADIEQQKEERDYPYKALEFQRQFLANLPLSTSSYGYSQPDTLSTILGGTGGILQLLRDIGVVPK